MAMDDILAQALAITRAQAAVRPMSAVEAASYAAEIARGIQEALAPKSEPVAKQEEQIPACDPKLSIRDNSIICLECGKSFRVLTIRHLRQHGLDAKSYKEKWGLKKTVTLSSKSLVRMRRKKMNEAKIWEKTPQFQAEHAGETTEE